MTCAYGGNCASTRRTANDIPPPWKNALDPLCVIWSCAFGAPSFASSFASATMSSHSRRSSWMALSGMSIVADAWRPLTLTSIFERRWPSVVTMRTMSPSHSKSAELRCARVSSVEIEKCVFAMSSCRTSTSSASDGDPSDGAGSGGKSSPGMPRSV